MTTTLSTFLRTVSNDKNDKTSIKTHTRIGDKDAGIFGGSYNIPKNKLNQFYQLYYDEVFVKGNSEYLTEAQNKNNGMMYVDLDFQYAELARHHDYEFINNVIDAYAELIKKYCSIGNEDGFKIYVMERDQPYNNGSKNRDGLHIIFDVSIERKIQKRIRKDMVETFDLSSLPLLNTADDVFDKGISDGTVNLQMVGSAKPNCKPYKIKYGFDFKVDDTDGECMITEFKPEMSFELFKTANASYEKKCLFLTKYGIKECEQEAIISPRTITYSNEPSQDNDISILIKLTECWSVDRINTSSEWFHLGWAITNAFGKSKEVEDIFVSLNDRVPNRNTNIEKEKAREWYRDKCEIRTDEKAVGLGSLKKWAKKDNEILYNELFPKKVLLEHKPASDKQFVCSDMEATEKVYKLYPNWKYCEGNLYVFQDGVWLSDDATYRAIISKFNDVLWVGVANRKTQLYEASSVKSYGNTTDLKNRIIKEMPSLCIDNDWIKRTERSSLGCLMFMNGYLNLRTGLFYDNETYPFNPDIVFTYKIPHKWVQENDADVMYRLSIEKRLFHDPLGRAVGDFLIYNLARGLAGDVMKRIIFGLGYGNTGKSTLSKALLRSCGGYVDTFNANNLAYKHTGQDQAQQNRWIMLKRNKRIILSNEINSQITLNGNGIKALSSGGDELEGRGHGEAERTFSIQFLSVVFANDLPTIKPYDDAIDKRIRVASYTKQYVDGEPSNEMELKGDPEIDSEIDTLRFQQAFVKVLILKYLDGQDGRFNDDPMEVIQAKQDWIGEEANCLALLQKDYEITNDPEDYVLSSEIKEWITQKKIGITMKRFGMDMKLYCCKNKLENVLSKDKKRNGKCQQAWCGIRYIRESYDCDEE